MSKLKMKSIGILGGTFDPPHKGHLFISNKSLKNFKLEKVYWVITKKNPFKNRPYLSLKKRKEKCTNLIKKSNKIELMFLEKRLKSVRAIDTIRYFKKNYNRKIFFIMGSDNLISFHKWKDCLKLKKMCKFLIFPRKGFDKHDMKSVINRYRGKKNFIFIKNERIDISSTQLRKRSNGNK